VNAESNTRFLFDERADRPSDGVRLPGARRPVDQCAVLGVDGE